MKDATPQPVRLAEYRPPNWFVDEVHLTFKLDSTATRVLSRIAFRPNPDAEDTEFSLDGEKLKLISASIDGVPVSPEVTPSGLTLDVPTNPFVWEAEVEIDPSSNTELEGLYISNGLYCTQCEAEGFRKITFYPDRPDVMAPLTVRVEADAAILLSNGNPIASGDGWAEWHDPWPKPSYLFALVAGDLVAHSGAHRTADGRDVTLNIWVRPGDQDRCAYALDALKRSMVWDEEVYGRNYDLDVFNLVAVDDFNAGAMENKGLNIFNSKYVLASPETATDRDYEAIESIVAHEYFHNWTGNRITCRDWFQLCLKEGLTVFRDQQFSGDMRGHAVKRIDDVIMLRGRQFREDAGPLAHPVRPESYVEINNFYTATVYEKGAELIGMLRRIVGDDGYRRALDLYFNRHDGQACTIEDWLKAFEDATGRDLGQFKLWYGQAGTPTVEIKVEVTGRASPVRATDGTETRPISWRVTAQQSVPPTPGQPEKRPVPIPIALALYDHEGREIAGEQMGILDTEEAVIATGSFIGSDRLPIVSAFRGFSAPVIVKQDLSMDDRLVLLAHDSDPFNRWEAGRALAKAELMRMVDGEEEPDARYLEALGKLIGDDTLDSAFRAFALGLPSEDDIAQTLYDGGQTPDPDRIHTASEQLKASIASAHAPLFTRLYEGLNNPGPYRPVAEDAGRRALRLAALGFLGRVEGPDRARALFGDADNMTESIGALACLLRLGKGADEAGMFYDRWRSDANTLDKWFSLSVACAAPDQAVTVAENMVTHPDFNLKNPNRFRAVLGGLAGNTAGFHSASGDGYAFVAKWLKQLDPINPMTAARMTTVFETLARYDGDRQGQIRDALAQLLVGKPSKDMQEIAGRILDV
ncbi:MAG: aminopeptidase N [Pseudomonadota bacterium]